MLLLLLWVVVLLLLTPFCGFRRHLVCGHGRGLWFAFARLRFSRIIACGSLFFRSAPVRLPPPPPAPPRLLTRSSGTNLNFVTHNSFTHGCVTHTHRQLRFITECNVVMRAHMFVRPSFVTHKHLSYATLSHTNFNQLYLTELFHHTALPPATSRNSFPYNFAAHNSFRQHCHTRLLSHTHTQQCHTVTHRNFCAASLALTALGWLRWPTLGFVTPNTLSLSHTPAHTQLCYIHFCRTRGIVTRTLPHIALSHTHTHRHAQLCHTNLRDRFVMSLSCLNSLN